MATVMHKPSSTPKWEPKFTQSPDRRRGSATGQIASSDNSRRGSTTSTSSSKGSGGEPAWMSSMRERDRNNSTTSTESAPETGGRRRSSLSGLFGRRQSLDERSSSTKKPEPKVVLGSKYAGQAKAKTNNVLKADPRGARKHPSTTTGTTKSVATEGLQSRAHITAADQEARHPHSGPPALHAGGSDLPQLTRIVSVEEPAEAPLEAGRTLKGGGSRQRSQLDLVNEQHDSWANGEEDRLPATQRMQRPRSEEQQMVPNGWARNELDEDQVMDQATGRPRRKSLLDVEVKAADQPRPSARGKMWGGGWHRDGRGNWTRK